MRKFFTLNDWDVLGILFIAIISSFYWFVRVFAASVRCSIRIIKAIGCGFMAIVDPFEYKVELGIKHYMKTRARY